jgi:hypothetical protein
MTVPFDAVAFVKRHGIVLESASGALPSIASAVAGERIRGSWWSHPKARAIYAATQAVRASPRILVCRLIDGKITFVHARLWPALVRLAEEIGAQRLAAIQEVHSASGAHRARSTSIRRWVADDVRLSGEQLSRDDAVAMLGSVLAAAIFAGMETR